MKLLVLIIAFFFTLFSPPLLAQEQQVVVPYTLADRDRAILTEAKLGSLESSINGRISSLESSINNRFEDQQRQLDDIKTLFYWGFGILITLFIFMLGYMIWDRRTAMQPALLHASKQRLIVAIDYRHLGNTQKNTLIWLINQPLSNKGNLQKPNLSNLRDYCL